MKNSNKIFDGLLVMEFQNGNTKALSLLVKRHHKDFCRYAHWYTNDPDLAQDIVQESWRVIIKKLVTLKSPNSFKSWALRIITRKSQDHLSALSRKRNFNKNYEPLPSNNPDQDDHLQGQLSRLRAAIEQLSFNQQLVLKLFYTEEYSLREISSILHISEGTVKSRLYHAREKLKSIINK